MIEALKSDFEQLYSIELSKMFYEKAKNRFANDKHVEIIHGDSGVVINRILELIDKPALFWLDGHYSEGETARGDIDTPIRKELEAIFKYQEYGHVIIIDDARFFGVDSDYPDIDELCNYIKIRRPSANINIDNDIIRIFL